MINSLPPFVLMLYKKYWWFGFISHLASGLMWYKPKPLIFSCIPWKNRGITNNITVHVSILWNVIYAKSHLVPAKGVAYILLHPRQTTLENQLCLIIVFTLYLSWGFFELRKFLLVSWFRIDTGFPTWMLNWSRIWSSSSFLWDIVFLSADLSLYWDPPSMEIFLSTMMESP